MRKPTDCGVNHTDPSAASQLAIRDLGQKLQQDLVKSTKQDRSNGNRPRILTIPLGNCSQAPSNERLQSTIVKHQLCQLESVSRRDTKEHRMAKRWHTSQGQATARKRTSVEDQPSRPGAPLDCKGTAKRFIGHFAHARRCNLETNVRGNTNPITAPVHRIRMNQLR